ncbi:MAG: PqqD family protein [Lachnospiraceae bacterium]|nr:PqqD family protein [Lachnospiraceae bacterium]
MKKRNKKVANYLEYIPSRNEKYRWETDEEGAVTIFVENKGVLMRITQKLINKPKVSQIHLEEMGSFIWPLIDGQRNILEIGVLVKEHFGDAAEPLYERLVQYLHSLEVNDFIRVKAVKTE